MDPQKVFIDSIRLKKFGIGSGELNPLAVDVHEAVKHLSAELYERFAFCDGAITGKLNAEDNSYAIGIVPTIEFLLTSKDVAGVGAMSTLLVLNNEVGFQEPNVQSLCSIGQSTKKGKRQSGGYVGEKGIGFKSVFLVSKKPHILSNGFRICFNQDPDEESKVGYIVPTWVDNPAIDSALNAVYGDNKKLPKTIIMLPIWDEKIIFSVREQLKEISPELVLFLSKIQKICFDFEGSQYSVRCETKQEQSSSMLRRVELSKQEGNFNRNVSYYIWTERFDVKSECVIEQRKDVRQWVISIAFPMGSRITGNLGVGDIFAFLPTQMKSGFSFLVNLDFLLISSRESIHCESPWNKGILDCIPQAFCNAFKSLLFTLPSNNTLSVYDFVPTENLASENFKSVCRRILNSLKSSPVILYARNVGFDGDLDGKFCMPEMARTIHESLRTILEETKEMGIPAPNLIRNGIIRIVDKRLQENYPWVLSVLEVPQLSTSEIFQLFYKVWLMELPEEYYLEVLCYISKSIKVKPQNMGFFRNTPLIKYMNEETGKVELASIPDASSTSEWRIYRPHNDQAWIVNWAKEFTPQVEISFMSHETVQCMQKAFQRSEKGHKDIIWLQQWLDDEAQVTAFNTTEFTEHLVSNFKDGCDARSFVKITHFIYNAVRGKHMDTKEAKNFMGQLKFLDSNGIVKDQSNATAAHPILLLPPSVSSWPMLITDDSWDWYLLKLSDVYLENPFSYTGREICSDQSDFIDFLKEVCGAKDMPEIVPANSLLPLFRTVLDPQILSQSAMILLFRWMKVQCCHTFGNDQLNIFRNSIRERVWMKTTHHGWKCPTDTFLYEQGSQWREAFEPQDLPFIDESFYGGEILSNSKPFLEWIGVPVEAYTHYSCAQIAMFMGQESLSRNSNLRHETAIRLYSYMKAISWWPGGKFSIPISVPGMHNKAIWKHKGQCVIEDGTGLFINKLSVLDRYYNDRELLHYFKSRLDVLARPKAEEYAELWLDWSKFKHGIGPVVKVGDCKEVWQVIATNWTSFPQDFQKHFILSCQQVAIQCNTSITTTTNSIGGGKDNCRQVQMRPVKEVLVVDDMFIVKVFEKANMCPRLAWFPTDSASAWWLGMLDSVYKDLGLDRLSSQVKRNCNFGCITRSQVICKEDGYFWKKGIWRLVLGYLATPSFGLTFPQRRSLILAVTKTTEYEVFNGITETFTLSVGVGSNALLSARWTSMVAWEKLEKQIFYFKRPEWNADRVSEKLGFMSDFARCISLDLLSEQFPSLTFGLQELLVSGGGYMFDDNASIALLRLKNMQLFEEDEVFLDNLNCVL